MSVPYRTIAFLLLIFLPMAGRADDRSPEIIRLVEKGEVEKVKALLAKEPSLIRAKDDMEQTALHVASNRDRVEIVELLLKAGADANARAYNEFTALHLTRDPKIVKLLVAHNADLEAKSLQRTALENAALHAGREPDGPKNIWRPLVKSLRAAGAQYTLLAAVRMGDADRAKELLSKDPSLGRSPDLMRDAAAAGHASVVRELLCYNADPTDADFGGLPLLYFALDHPGVVKVLLDAGATAKGPIEYKGSGAGPCNGITLLHEAADRGQTETAKLLIGHGAEVDARTNYGYTPFQWAAQSGHLETVRLLIKSGAEIRGERGHVAMTAAARQVTAPRAERRPNDNARRREMIRFLHTQGVPIDLTAAIALGSKDRAAELLRDRPARAVEVEPSGRPLLHRAIMLDHPEIVGLMLDAGASVDASDSDGDTTLHSAAFWGRDAIVKLLIERKATVDARNRNHATPLHEAARCAHPAAAKLLLAAGADVNAKDEKGWTPLMLAEMTVEQDERSFGKVLDESREVRDLLRDHLGKK
ncbi:MAG TPA: ankyrin repeat domain-containing protein [Gemmataceae bacterium]|nr:ankyrin repeat domain-containing protein [Gemmataceae bacterium]